MGTNNSNALNNNSLMDGVNTTTTATNNIATKVIRRNLKLSDETLMKLPHCKHREYTRTIDVSGTVTGDILLNGAKPDRYYNRCFGYVEQFDSHMSCLTVQEAIHFSANLRLPADMSDAQRHKIVEKVMKQLEIKPLAHKRIGGAADNNSISQEARKKVTIAVELVSNPGLLYLDELTTGLDGGAAYAIMKTVRKLADEEKCSVICTIHQPSAEVFNLFDKILLLQASGKMVYFDDIHKLKQYYKTHGFGSMPKGRNPADFAIEAIPRIEYTTAIPRSAYNDFG